jgi:hypothetical protein
MSAQTPAGRLSIREFLKQIRRELVPLNTQISYFAAGSPLTEEDVRDYLEDPIAALPPAALERLPKIILLLVPYLERANGRASVRSNGHAPPVPEDLMSCEQPEEGKALRAVHWIEDGQVVVALAVDEMEVADYHHELYRQLASWTFDHTPVETLELYWAMLREELANRMHGEVDEESWQRKQGLLRRSSPGRRDSKAFREYARSSFVDTMTLYLHGICCDIDVEPGPRQLPSRNLRKRLKLLQEMFPQPKGYAVFPEELDRLETRD